MSEFDGLNPLTDMIDSRDKIIEQLQKDKGNLEKVAQYLIARINKDLCEDFTLEELLNSIGEDK